MTATAADFTIDVLTGRHGTTPRPRCAWGDCDRKPSRSGQFPCPKYCQRHCIVAEGTEGHACERTRHRTASREFMRRHRTQDVAALRGSPVLTDAARADAGRVG